MFPMIYDLIRYHTTIYTIKIILPKNVQQTIMLERKNLRIVVPWDETQELFFYTQLLFTY